MLELIIVATVVAGTAYRIDALNDRAIANGNKPELSMSNPFHWVKVLLGFGAYGVGYAPKAIKRGAKEAKVLHAQAKREALLAGVQQDMHLKTMQRAGKVTSHMHHSRRIKKLDIDLERLQKELDKL